MLFPFALSMPKIGMSTLALKTASGVAATCGLAVGKTLGWILVLGFTVGIWLAILLTAIWPFVAAYVLVCGPDEMIRYLPFNAVCWAFNVAGLFFIAWTGRRS